MANDTHGDPVGLEMGRRIRIERAAKGWTQEELSKATGWRQTDADEGKAIGLSPSRIANYEQGTRRLDTEEAEVLAQVFDMPSAYFLTAVSAHEARVLQALRSDDPALTGTGTLRVLGAGWIADWLASQNNDD
jgi:transcriptional regulator with XRE-family HTH domain